MGIDMNDSRPKKNIGHDPFNRNSDREKWSTSKGRPVFSKLFQLDRTDPLSFGPKFPEILVEWIRAHWVRFLSIDRWPEASTRDPTTLRSR